MGNFMIFSSISNKSKFLIFNILLSILPWSESVQLNCRANPAICLTVCNEIPRLNFSSTFCNPGSGSCVCDCRNVLKEECSQTPFTPCFQGCVKENPNPDVFLYTGGNCPVSNNSRTGSDEQNYQCACQCQAREDYYETNDVY